MTLKEIQRGIVPNSESLRFRTPKRIQLGAQALALVGFAGCAAMDNASSIPEGVQVEADMKAVSMPDGPETGLISILGLTYMGRDPAKYVCAESAGADPLVANRSKIGYWEQYMLTLNSDDGTYTIRSLANGKRVYTPTNPFVTEADGPLIANFPPHYEGSSCFTGCHASAKKAESDRFYIKRQSDPNTYRLFSKVLKPNIGWGSSGWVTQSDRTIMATGSMYVNPYRILTDKLTGDSAQSIVDNKYTWNSTYIGEQWCRGPLEGGVNYTLKVSNVTGTTRVRLFFDDQQVVEDYYFYANGEYTLPRACGPAGYNMHNIRVEFSRACTLDTLGWITHY